MLADGRVETKTSTRTTTTTETAAPQPSRKGWFRSQVQQPAAAAEDPQPPKKSWFSGKPKAVTKEAPVSLQPGC